MKTLFALFAVAALALSAGPSPSEMSRWFAPDAEGYLTAEVAIGSIRRSITATGSLQAVSTVEVSSQLSGQIARLHADFNDTVTDGQPLAELDQRSLRALVDQAEAKVLQGRENLAIRTAQLDRARGVELEAVARRKIFRAQVDQAIVSLAAAERQLARTAKLAARGTVAQSKLEDVQSARDTAAAELRQAEAVADAHEHVVAASQAGRREAEAELSNAEAALPLNEAALELARLDLDRSTIRSPIDGVVVGRNVEQGQTVAVSLDAPTLFTIAGDLSEMEIHANIDETDIGEIAVGQTAEFTVDAFPGRSFVARVSQIRKAARVVQGVVIYTVVLQASNAGGLLLPGMTSTVRIVVAEVGPVPTVPLASLRFVPAGRSAMTGDNRNGQTVWVVDRDGMPQSQEVQLGADDGRDIAVLGGSLSQGDQVITGRATDAPERGLFGIRF
jgi:HlyD family secretion protein